MRMDRWKTVPTIVKWLSVEAVEDPGSPWSGHFSPDYPETPIYYLH